MSKNTFRSCLICGDADALKRVDICRDHFNMIREVSPVENHHPEGRGNSPETIRTPTSIHFILSRKQDEWPEPLRYPSSDPVIQIARREQLMLDFIEYYGKAARRDPNFLLALALDQQKHNGPGWWRPEGIAPLSPDQAVDHE